MFGMIYLIYVSYNYSFYLISFIDMLKNSFKIQEVKLSSSFQENLTTKNNLTQLKWRLNYLTEHLDYGHIWLLSDEKGYLDLAKLKVNWLAKSYICALRICTDLSIYLLISIKWKGYNFVHDIKKKLHIKEKINSLKW